MEKKIVFFDIDGTLLDGNKQLPSSTRAAIEALKTANVDVAIATGRAPFMFESLREELGIDTFVSYNGQYVEYKGETVYRNPLHREALEGLRRQCEEHSYGIVYMGQEEARANRQDEYVDLCFKGLKFEHPPVDEDYYKQHEIYQALIFCTADDEEKLVHDYDHFRFVRWHELSSDVMPSNGSKAEGIKSIMEVGGYALENVYAFGDGLNDIEMMEFVGVSVAMGNAEHEVKTVAKHVTKHVNEDGILHGLKAIGLL